MGKYTNLQKAFETVIASNAWKRGNLSSVKVIPTNIQTFKKDAKTGTTPKEFLRLVVLPGEESNVQFGKFGVAGQLIVEIYTETNKGPTRYMEIADTLDGFFQAQSIKTKDGNIQTYSSLLTKAKVDEVNPNYYSSDYTVSFTYYA